MYLLLLLLKQFQSNEELENLNEEDNQNHTENSKKYLFIILIR